jgi:hypothetical protein
VRAPKSVQVKLNLKIFEVSGTWEPNDAERRAAWELYTELITRIAVVPLRPGEGLVREALDSLYLLFTSTRDILRRYGPEIAEPKPDGQYNFGYLAVALLNIVLRPFLARWHPALDDWETSRPPTTSRQNHERAWSHADELRRELNSLQVTISEYAALLATACGVPDLSAALPAPLA